MTRVVLDANVLAPGFLSDTSSSGQLIDLWRQQRYELVVSEHLLAELTQTYTDPYFRRRISPNEVARILRLLRRRALLIEITVPVSGVATRPKDDLVLAAGLSAKASYLATRDRQLLKLGYYQGLQIVHPADLAASLRQAGEPP